MSTVTTLHTNHLLPICHLSPWIITSCQQSLYFPYKSYFAYLYPVSLNHICLSTVTILSIQIIFCLSVTCLFEPYLSVNSHYSLQYKNLVLPICNLSPWIITAFKQSLHALRAVISLIMSLCRIPMHLLFLYAMCLMYLQFLLYLLYLCLIMYLL